MRQSAIAETAPLDSPKRTAIVAAATELFLGSGFGAVSMDRIAAQARVSKRTVYSHFENKETLFAAVMGAVCEDIVGGELCPLASEDFLVRFSPSELLHRTGVYLLTIIASDTGIELYRLVSAESNRFPQLGQTFHDNGPGMMLEAMREYLTENVKTGVFAIDDVKTAAGQFFGMIMQPVQMELSIGVRKKITAKEIDAIVSNAVDAFMGLYAKENGSGPGAAGLPDGIVA